MKPQFTISVVLLAGTIASASGQALKDVSAPMLISAPHVQPLPRIAPTPRTIGMAELYAVEDGVALPALREDEVRKPGSEGQTSIGRVQEIIIDPESAGMWSSMPDGSMFWTVQITSPNAISLRVRFEEARLPVGAALIVFSPDIAKAAYGPYGAERFRKGLPFWASTVIGNRVNVEYYLPPEVVEAGMIVAPRIGGVAMGFPDAGGGARGNECRIDVASNATWATAALGVAMMQRPIGGGSVSLCTGSLITRIPGDGAPLFLTAGHCIDTEAEANAVEAFWFFQSNIFPDPLDAPTTNGATLLAVDTGADTSLLALLEDPPVGATHNGWNTGDPGLGTNGTIIHHPSGTQKAISFGEFQVFTVAACGSGWNTWFFPLSNGGQEGGSSGGPVFTNAGQQIRAVASCSSDANCGPNEWTWEGSLRHGFDVLGPFMDVADDVWVDIGNAGTERGTQADPWDELIEAYFGVPDGGVVHIVSGSYPAFDFTRSRAMTLTAEGGVVVIGN